MSGNHYESPPYARMDFLQNYRPPATGNITFLFTLEDTSGALKSALEIFHCHGVSLKHIESHPSRNFEWEHDFIAEAKGPDTKVTEAIIADLQKFAKNVHLIGDFPGSPNISGGIPWFPRKMSDLDSFADKVLECGQDLSADHPGFTDEVYRARRAEITRIARTYKTGQPVPPIEYTETEIATWYIKYDMICPTYLTRRHVYTKLLEKHPSKACREHQYVFPLLQQNCGYSPDRIPQLEDVSKFLRECTGFSLRPVMGLLSSRDFLNGLAFRVFHSTQYIRHHSKPEYTPEPDVCHELLGHAPLFADPEFAAFSQEIGLASLGASDEDISRLATIYWFTIEFGLCKEGDSIRAYGAGLLSSFGELEWCLSGKPTLIPFDPAKTSATTYPITEYQPTYFVAESFLDAQQKIREFAATLRRPFAVKYNPYTQSIDLLDTKEKVLRFAANIGNDLQNLISSIRSL